MGLGWNPKIVDKQDFLVFSQKQKNYVKASSAIVSNSNFILVESFELQSFIWRELNTWILQSLVSFLFDDKKLVHKICVYFVYYILYILSTHRYWENSVSFFFKVDGITNPQIQSIHLEDFPIYKARFSAEGEQVIATSIHNKLFYIYDMMEGKIIPINHIRGNCFSLRFLNVILFFCTKKKKLGKYYFVIVSICLLL